MPKKATLVPHLSSTELKNRYQKTTNPIESRRWHLLWKISVGWTIKNSALAVGLSYSYAQKILLDYNKEGERAIKVKKKRKQTGGKKPLLNEEQLEKLKLCLKSRPNDGGVWTGPKVARWIEKETGVEKVWNQRGWDYLKKCKYSW